jgi:hypothetical protein
MCGAQRNVTCWVSNMTSRNEASGPSDGSGEVAALRARVAELEERLRIVTAERDEALVRLEAVRGARFGVDFEVGCSTGSEPELTNEGDCRSCEGEGVFWVHDFRMDCKRCGGTGRAPAR